MEWELAQERTISGKGVLQVPGDHLKIRSSVLFINVVREPTNMYVSRDWNPQRSRFANLVFLRQGYVISHIPVEFDGQAFDGINDVCGQNLIALKCAYAGILQTFTNLAAALASTPGSAGLSVVSITDTIKDYENLANAWDEIRIKCYADTAINVKMYTLKYDTCDPLKDKDKPPPLPPPPPEKVPPGTPVPNSYPYDEETHDSDNSRPFPGDDPQPPTVGEPCEVINLTYTYTQSFNGNLGNPITASLQVYGKVGEISVQAQPGGFTYFYLECQGIITQGYEGASTQCKEYDNYRFTTNNQTFPAITVETISIVSATPVG